MPDPKADPKICVALLAAGSARRFGGGKLDAECAGKPLGRWAMEAVEQAGLGQNRFCVVGPDAPSFIQGAAGWGLVANSDPDAGLGSSLAVAAVEAERLGADALLVLLGDMPLVTGDFLAGLAAQKAPAATDYGPGRVGVPALFPARLFSQLQGLTGDRGAALLLASLSELERVDPPAEMLMDVDITSDIGRAEDALRNR